MLRPGLFDRRTNDHEGTTICAPRFDPSSLAVCIVTYNRPTALNRAIREWRASSPPGTPIYVISNHSRVELAPDTKAEVKLYHNNLRLDQSNGYLTRNWNQAFMLGFLNHDWLICSQDDVSIKPGWIKEIMHSQPRDLYVAPQGDVVFLLHRNVLRQVGWFDERFAAIGSHEFDYWFRCYKVLGAPRMSFVDTLHNWKPGENELNGIGLEHFWQSTFRDGERYRDWIGAAEENVLHWIDKWGKPPQLSWAFAKRRIRLREIDWYPWYFDLLQEKADRGK